MNMTVKWRWTTRSGQCPYIRISGYRYFIQQDIISGYYYIGRVEDIKPKIHKYTSYQDLHKAVSGRSLDPGTNEDRYYTEIMTMTWGDFRNLREYRLKNGDHIVIDMKDRSWRLLYKEEIFSPYFRTINEAKDWANEYIQPDPEQMELNF